MDIDTLGREDSWAGVRALVVGFDADGQSAADNLLHLGATVVALDPAARPEATEFAELLTVLGAEVVRGADIADDDGWREGPRWDLLVVTGDSESGAVLQDAIRRHPDTVRVSALDLARQLEPDQTWLLVGATTADDPAAQRIARLTAAMLRAAGISAAPAGGPERSAMELVMEPERYDVLVVAVTADVIAATGSLRPHSACVITGKDGLGLAFTDVEHACVYSADDSATEDMVRDAEVVEGARAIGVTIGTPGVGMLGVVDDVLCDRAFVDDRQTSAAEICVLDDLGDHWPDTVREVLASVALARAYGVALAPIRHAIGETF